MSRISCEILVVGSGPGGSITACLLAEAGWNVLLIEEGSFSPLSPSKSYSSEEMDQKYRHSGLTVALGKHKIAYAEARCLGGGSEINSGLYHRPLPQTIRSWRDQFQVEGLEENLLETCLEETEKDLSVSPMPQHALSSPSLKLQEGANKLGWKHTEILRCFKYRNADGTWVGDRQSMSETYLPRAKRAGAKILPNTKMDQLLRPSRRQANKVIATQTTLNGGKERIEISFQYIFLCAGAIQTPFLLRKSGIYHNIGNSLRMHPMVRVAASFREEINDDRGVPVVQIDEFKPDLTLGCSCSSPGHLALWVNGTLQERQKKLDRWKQMAIYYAAITTEGMGTVRHIPLIPEPFVRYELTSQDMKKLGEGLYRLGKILFASGAQELLFPIQGYESVTHLNQLTSLQSEGLPYEGASITSIHLFSSCPMGENRHACAVNSYGQLHGYENIYLNDASILPDCPGVNPQATLMAIARRNVKHFCARKKDPYRFRSVFPKKPS